jgi:hypothetical protein
MTLNITNGNTTQSYPYSAGYVAFGDGLNWIIGSAQFFWDNNSSRLGIQTTTPEYQIDVRNGCIAVEGNENYTFHWRNQAEAPPAFDVEVPASIVGTSESILGMPAAWLYVHVNLPDGETVLVIPAYTQKP